MIEEYEKLKKKIATIKN